MPAYLSVLQVDLIAEHHEREVLGVSRAGLDQELISPAVQSFESVGCGHVKHQHAAVCSAVECHTQRLEPLLACRVPDLKSQIGQRQFNEAFLPLLTAGIRCVAVTNLHGNEPVIHHHLLGQKVGAYCSFVLVTELFVHILVHE